jgi:pimeloyl-ACP methyl ester carboxylesterase
MRLTSYHPFISSGAKRRYLQRYDARGKDWPVAADCLTVETSYGPTFVRASGPEQGPALVLLPSASATSLFWEPNVAALSANYRVFAVDNIYDFGRSVYHRPLRSAQDFIAWLDSLFDALQLEKVNLMGLSYGAWIICNYARLRGSRVSKAVIISPPATLFPLPPAWAWYGITALIPHRFFLRNMLNWMFPELTQTKDQAKRRLLEELFEDAYTGLRCFKLKMVPAPTVLSDEELGQIEVPALFLVGDQEVLYPAARAVERLHQVAPRIQTEIIPRAGHDLTLVQAELVNGKVLEFLRADGRAG